MPKLLDREPTQEMLKAIASSDCATSNYKRMFQAAYDAAPDVKQEPFGYVREIRPMEWKFSKTTSWGPEVWKPVFTFPIDAQAEIAKLNARIDSLTAAGAEYQRQCFEQAAEISRLKSELQDLHKRNYVTHSLFETGDTACPEQAKDRNGEVVLGVCKNCGRVEVELAEPCDRRKEIQRLKAVIAKCEEALLEAQSVRAHLAKWRTRQFGDVYGDQHENMKQEFSLMDETLAAIKEEGL